MSQSPASAASPLSCRRCGGEYEHNARALLASCPHCGAATIPLRKRIRHNGLAAVLAVLALGMLLVGIFLPFISMNKLGQVRIFSLIGGVRELFDSGNNFIAVILLVFSILFPIAKLLMLLLATSGLVSVSLRTRVRLHTVAVFTGKYSLLDVLVVAVMIVIVKVQPLAEVKAEIGTTLFSIAVLLSIAAGLCVNLDELRDEKHE